MRALAARPTGATVDPKKRWGRIPLKNRGAQRIGKLLLEPKDKAKVRLLVYIPEAFRKNAYDVSIVHLVGGRPVGRFTYRLAPQRRR
jgi:hypothetical protein